MLVKDVQKVYYVKDGNYFNVPHLSGDIDNYDFPINVVENHDIKIFKQCLDGHIEKILIEPMHPAHLRKQDNTS